MTDKEYINNIKTISTKDLLNNLENYGHDNYYDDLYRTTMQELKERFCWHSVKDRDLPTKSGEYLTVNNRGHYDVLRYCVEDNLGPYDEDYDFEKNDNMTNLKKGFNDFDGENFEYYLVDSIVEWMEIPEYE